MKRKTAKKENKDVEKETEIKNGENRCKEMGGGDAIVVELQEVYERVQ